MRLDTSALIDEIWAYQGRKTLDSNRGDLGEKDFDVLVVGAGMFGACVARSATLRGLSVAVIDKGDFGGATSANHYKMVHGGIRYLQHLDIPRVRESSRERSALLRIAPHLTYPIPIVLPTYGHGRRSKWLMRAAMLAYDMVTGGKNRRITDPDRRIPRGATIGREEVLRMFPGLPTGGLTGAAVFYDGQMYNPARLVLAFLRSAVSNGARVANYVSAKRLLQEGRRVVGCSVQDNISGREFVVRSRFVVNATGPWAHRLFRSQTSSEMRPDPSFSRDLAFVVDGSVCPTHALGCHANTKDTDAVLDRGGRHLFLVPWRGKTLVGVWHCHSNSHPDNLAVSKEQLLDYVDEINDAYPAFGLGIEDIRMINTGLVLFGSEQAQRKGNGHSFGKRSILVDHNVHGLEGLITLVGARATVARGLGERAVDLMEPRLGPRRDRISAQWEPIHGGSFDKFEVLVDEILRHLPCGRRALALAIAHNYGSEYPKMFACSAGISELDSIGSSNVLFAEVRHAVRHEMATSLEDVVLRRTELCSAGDPGEADLRSAAKIVAEELGWSEEQCRQQLSSVQRMLQKRGPWTFVDYTDQVQMAPQ